jgi:hypothetical protein
VFAYPDGVALVEPLEVEDVAPAPARRGPYRPAPVALPTAAARTRPVALAREALLPVAPAFEGLLPEPGLRRGTTVAVGGGPGATSLALALGAAASASGSWAGAVGLPSLGLEAVGELGVALERLLLVEPPLDRWATVVASLLDAVDLVHVALPPRVRLGDARRLAARARERGAVLVVHAPGAEGAGAWPEPPAVRLTVAEAAWEGPAGGGAGRLTARRVEVVGGGRGAAARPRRAALWLPDATGAVRLAEPVAVAGGSTTPVVVDPPARVEASS